MHYNLVNESMNCQKSAIEPKLGMCGTMFCGTDRWPMVITEVISKKKIRLAMMNDKDYQMSERVYDKDSNEYLPEIYLKDYAKVDRDAQKIMPAGEIYSFRKNHRWIEEGHSMWETGAVHLGKADEYRDPDF